MAPLYRVEFGGRYNRGTRTREGLKACRGAAVLDFHHWNMGIFLGGGLLAASARPGFGLRIRPSSVTS
jgi:hypothetical protein